jgi:hypothetical protein
MINKKIELHPSMSTFNDYNNSNERYVAKLIWDDGVYQNLPKIGQSILDEYKKIYINRICDLPNDAWDIGHSQLKKKFPNDFNLLNNLLIELEELMRPMVYELGFLLK